MIHNTSELWPAWVTRQWSVCSTVTPAVKGWTGCLSTNSSVIHTDQYKPGARCEETDKGSESERRRWLIDRRETRPQSIFAPIHVSQNSFNLHLNWKSSYRHWQTFCLNVLFRPQDLNKLYDWTGTMPVMLSSVVHSYSALMTYSHRIWWK